MNRQSHGLVPKTAMYVAVLIGISGTAVAQSVTKPETEAVTQALQTASGDAVSEPRGEVAEFQHLRADGRLATVRSSANGSYSAQMLFDRQDGRYYAALLQHDNVWRVIAAGDEAQANATYLAFRRQTEKLGDVELRRTRAEAEKLSAERQLAETQDKENRLRADIDVAKQQAQAVAERESQQRAEVDDLRAQRDAATAQLIATQAQVGQLQRQVYAGLPVAARSHRAKPATQQATKQAP
ncbi:DUF2968 domain-containing protein [Paraburkholderia sp. BR14263]|uniref:DUF2968 domain-containing protein n=1 Tax=unclassified Paraburkholderia TaxID=2615204 RepID=UPI0034CEA356